MRLENASWRTWWKQRKNLKTVMPETLNWHQYLLDTWLYGPLLITNDTCDDDGVEDAEVEGADTKSKSMDHLSMLLAKRNTARPPDRAFQEEPGPRIPWDQLAAVVLPPPIVSIPEHPTQAVAFWENAMHPDVSHGIFNTIQRDQTNWHFGDRNILHYPIVNPIPNRRPLCPSHVLPAILTAQAFGLALVYTQDSLIETHLNELEQKLYFFNVYHAAVASTFFPLVLLMYLYDIKYGRRVV